MQSLDLINYSSLGVDAEGRSTGRGISTSMALSNGRSEEADSSHQSASKSILPVDPITQGMSLLLTCLEKLGAVSGQPDQTLSCPHFINDQVTDACHGLLHALQTLLFQVFEIPSDQ